MALSLEQAKHRREKLSAPDQSALDLQCEEEGHQWQPSNTNEPQKYCNRCYQVAWRISQSVNDAV
jgi:hypothetical protein